MSRCKTCPFIQNTSKISGPKRSVNITDRFTCTSANVIITCILCKKLYIGETGRRLGDRFREHLRGFEKDDKDASKPVARHFNLPNHFKQHMAICGLSLHQGTTKSRKNLEQKLYSKSAHFIPTVLTNAVRSFIQLIHSCFSRCHVTTNSVAPPPLYEPHTTHNSSIRSDEGVKRSKRQHLESLYGGQFTLSTPLMIFFFWSVDKTKNFCDKHATHVCSSVNA